MANFMHLSLVMQLTTVPQDPATATPRTGGWTEGVWTNKLTFADLVTATVFPGWPNWRANILPASASVLGYKGEIYTLSGNKLLPVTSISGKLFRPGNATYATDVPQMGLDIGAMSAGASGSSRLKTAGLPDQFVVGGEYAPDAGFKRALTIMQSWMMAGGSCGWMGRDLSQAPVRVIALAAGVLTTDSQIQNLNVNDWVRFKRVSDQNGNPVKGAFQVSAIAPVGQTWTYTLRNPPAQTVIKPSGTVRRDLLVFYPYTSFGDPFVVQRKVGAPSRRYRGRRSKSRV